MRNKAQLPRICYVAKFAAAKCACQGSESYTDPFVKPCSLGKLKLMATESLVLSHNSNSFHRSYPEQPRKYNHAACAHDLYDT